MSKMMKTVVSIAVGLIVGWLGFQVFHFNQMTNTAVAVVLGCGTYALMDKLSERKSLIKNSVNQMPKTD